MNEKPIIPILFCLCVGIILGTQFSFPIGWLILIVHSLFLISIVITVFIKNPNRILTNFLFGLTLMVFGCFWIHFFQNNKSAIHLSRNSFLYKQEIEIQGMIIDQPLFYSDKYRCLFRLEKARFHNIESPVEGKIVLNLPVTPIQMNYGDRLKITGILRKPLGRRNPGAFDYAAYLRQQDIHAICSIKDTTRIKLLARKQGNLFFSSVVFPLRSLIIKQLDLLNSPAHASFLKGLLLGDKQDISRDFLDALTKTGTSHILSVSGLHTGFILSIVWIFLHLLRLPRFFIVTFTVLALVLYAFLTYLKPPIVRAVIMASIFLIGSLIQRRRDQYSTLAFAALVVLLLNPFDLFNPGFQLSFGAIFAILYLYPKLVRFVARQKWTRPIYRIQAVRFVVDLLIMSLAVQILTLPLTTWYFNLIPVTGLIANVVVVPIIGLNLAVTIVSMVVNSFSTFLADLYIEANDGLIWFTVQFVKFVAHLPASYSYVPRPDFLWILAFVISLFALAEWRKKHTRKVYLAGILIILNIIVWKSVFVEKLPLKITHFDVGQGDAALIELRGGPKILVDAGTVEFGYNYGKWVILPFLRQQGIAHLDMVSATHPHNDHIGGLLTIFREISVAQVIDNGDTINSPIFKNYLRLIDSLAIPRRSICQPQVLNLTSECEMWFFNPRDSVLKTNDLRSSINNNSIVYKLWFGKKSFLFTGDAEFETESKLAALGDLLKCDVLKVGHHGSMTSSCLPFIKAANPQFCVISVGEFNRFKHPSRKTIERLKNENILILRTDYSGAIVWETDGNEVKRIRWK